MTISQIRLTLQRDLDSHKTSLERNILGQFATPPDLARQIVVSTLEFFPSDAQIRFLEPALGTGSFFEALSEKVGDRIESAVGVEIDRSFATASLSLWNETVLQVVEGDFTAIDPAKFNVKANLLITNPPYVRHHHIETERKRELVRLSKRIAGVQPSGLAGLYVHFMLIAHRWLAKGAISTWLIPSEFMDVNYGAELKRYLTERVQLLRIHSFSPEDVQFDDALVTSTVVIFRNELPKPENLIRFSVGGSMLNPRQSIEVPVNELPQSRKWSSFQSTVSRQFDVKSVLTLGEAFTIKRGLATGDNGFFIRSVQEFQTLEIPDEFLKPILPSPRVIQERLVEADCDGYPLLKEKLALFDCSLAESDLERRFPTVHKFVLAGKSLQVDQGYLCKGRKPWYSQEKREAPPIVCTYMGRMKSGQPPVRIIRNKSKAIATNVYLLLYPKPWLLKADYDGSLMDRICEELGSLSSSAFISEGRVYGGGLHKMEPKELARIPLNLEELQSADKCVLQNVLFEGRQEYV